MFGLCTAAAVWYVKSSNQLDDETSTSQLLKARNQLRVQQLESGMPHL